jgi:hypothetical protein
MANDNSLINAVKAGDIDTVRNLIDSNADLNCVDEQGWTSLNFAVGRGDLPMVKLLVENGADIFKVGRDLRYPYMIALAAGRVSVAKYLKQVEDSYIGERPISPERKYCKAYHLENLREYTGWSESQINWKDREDLSDGNAKPLFTDDKVVFIHQDFTVTESMWHNENVIFNEVDSAWKEFCVNTLKFKVPDDLDLIVENDPNT